MTQPSDKALTVLEPRRGAGPLEQAPGALPLAPALLEQAQEVLDDALSPNTKRAYFADWRLFTAWCSAHGLSPLPADPRTVALYLTARADEGLKFSTLRRYVAAIGTAHRRAGHDPPGRSRVVADILKGLRRRLGAAPARATALVVEDLVAAATAGASRNRHHAGPGAKLREARDKAVLLLGFAAALRRSEIAALAVTDLERRPEGLVVTIRRSKTDQSGLGRQVGVPRGARAETCPVEAVEAWLAAASVTEGPLFRRVVGATVAPEALSGRAIAEIVEAAAAAAGLQGERYSGHSLRRGLATTAARAGKGLREIMAQGRWSAVSTVAGYLEEAALLSEKNAARGLGL